MSVIAGAGPPAVAARRHFGIMFFVVDVGAGLDLSPLDFATLIRVDATVFTGAHDHPGNPVLLFAQRRRFAKGQRAVADAVFDPLVLAPRLDIEGVGGQPGVRRAG